MSALILSMLRSRWGQAVTLFLLATVAVAATVAGPVSKRATDVAVVRVAVEHASARELSITAISFADPTAAQNAERFDALAQAGALPGAQVIRAGELMTFGPGRDLASARQVLDTRVVFRDGVCEHLAILSGRCLVSAGEIVIGEETASRQGLAAGDVATVQAMTYSPDGTAVATGDPARLTVVGIYRPLDADEPYWAAQGYFRFTAAGTRAEAVFTTEPGMEHIPHTSASSYVDIVMSPEALTPQRMAGLEAEVEHATTALSKVSNIVLTDLPRLGDRVEASRGLAGQLGPVAFVPLAAISLFVIYLAVGYGVFGRRREIGLVALRGLPTSRRWLLAGGEAALPILLAAPVGYLLGHVGVAEFMRLRLGSSDGAQLSLQSAPYAAVALLVALGVALLGQRRALREPVVELLRGVPRAAPAWQAITIEVLVTALAVLAALQLRSSRSLAGLGLLVPGLLMVAVALVVARVFVPLTGLVARRALRRGWLGTGLAAAQLARRPGSHRLFALLAVGTAMLAFVAAGSDVASRAREDRATVTTGATRVLRVANADAAELVRATQEVDPDGAWAMAVMTLDPPTPQDAPVLAVDASRLGSVAAWRTEFGADVAEVAAQLEAPSPTGPDALAPLEFRGTAVELDAEVDPDAGSVVSAFDLEINFVRLVDGERVTLRLNDVGPGRGTFRAGVQGCEDGCRLASLAIPDAEAGATMTFYSLRQVDPPAAIVSPADFSNEQRWRTSPNANLVVAGSALVVLPLSHFAGPVEIGVLSAFTPVPVVAAGRSEVTRIVSLDQRYVESHVVRSLAMLPRLGQQGVMVDLRYLQLTLVAAPLRSTGEVWLGASAPPNASALLRSAGLAVVDETGVDEAREELGIGGPALALQFHLAAAVAGVLLALGGLALVTTVDRRSRAADLWVLRVQGLRRRVARRAGLWGYLSTVVLAALTGLAGAEVAWVVAGDRLPIFTDTGSVLAPPRWPHWPAVLQPWGWAAAAMVLATVVASWALRRRVAR